jgi:hypothetical protein
MLKKVLAVLVVVILVGTAIAGWAAMRQPHMAAALEHLKAARAELEVAEHNKGGHREKAIDLVDRAIAQTKKGIEAGEKGF